MLQQKKISFPRPAPERRVVRIIIQVPPEEIAYVVTLVESLGHVAIPRTIDQGAGLMELLVAPDCIDEARQLLTSMCWTQLR